MDNATSSETGSTGGTQLALVSPARFYQVCGVLFLLSTTLLLFKVPVVPHSIAVLRLMYSYLTFEYLMQCC